jgi:tetratricopeptide (TPR) repeat protein
VVAAAEAWLQNRSGPFLAWIHFYDPHAPYDAPEPERALYPERPYDAEVAHADGCFGRIERAARHAARDRLLTALVADHGEALGDHGERTHGFFVYDATLRVPFLLRGPGVPRGARRPGPARTADVLPTLLALLGAPTPETDGREILRQPSAREAYAETEFPKALGFAPLASFRSGALKYIDAPRPELYDMSDDPNESRDLAAARPEDSARLRSALASLRARSTAPVAAPRDAQASERLRALGYVSGGAGATTIAGRDPKDALPDWLLFEDATGRSNRGDHPAALASFRELVARDPKNAGFQRGLAAALEKAGRPAEALFALDALVSLAPGDALAWQSRAALLLEAGRLDAARESVARALAETPDAPEALVESGVIEARSGHGERALAAFEKALRLDPTNPRAWTNQGNVLRDLGRSDAARAAYLRARELAPRDAEALNGLGVIAVQSGEPDPAAAFFEEALAADPSHGEARLNLAVAEALCGRKDAARARAEEVVKLTRDPKLAARARSFLNDLPRFAPASPAPR